MPGGRAPPESGPSFWTSTDVALTVASVMIDPSHVRGRGRVPRSPAGVDPVVHASTGAVVGWHADARGHGSLGATLASGLGTAATLAAHTVDSEAVGAPTNRLVFLRIDLAGLTRSVLEGIAGSFLSAGIDFDRVVVLAASSAGAAPRVDLSDVARRVNFVGLRLGLVLDGTWDLGSSPKLDARLSHVVLPAEAFVSSPGAQPETFRCIRELALSSSAELVIDRGVTPAGHDMLRRLSIQLAISPDVGSECRSILRMAGGDPAWIRRCPIPADELERLRQVYRSGILDSPSERCFDGFAARAAAVADAPMSAVSIIDVDQQWFTSGVGLAPGTSTPRDSAFCAHTVCSPDPLIVSDALADARFVSNPLVQGKPWIRSYLGAPIVSHVGCAYGAIFVADVVAREFRSDVVATLVDFARRTAARLDRRAALTAIREREVAWGRSSPRGASAQAGPW